MSSLSGDMSGKRAFVILKNIDNHAMNSVTFSSVREGVDFSYFAKLEENS